MDVMLAETGSGPKRTVESVGAYSKKLTFQCQKMPPKPASIPHTVTKYPIEKWRRNAMVAPTIAIKNPMSATFIPASSRG